MIYITDKTKCCGCTACVSVCPKSCITMKADEEGFLYPYVNETMCVNCGVCENVCPIIHSERQVENTRGYIIRYNDENIVRESTSGGAFTAFAMDFLINGAVVFGTGYDENMQIVCKKAIKPEDLGEMRGSKFVQSNLDGIFTEIKQLLKQGKKVVFSGTPCQNAGLVNFLSEKTDNLFCIDFVCRGVMSPELWKNYIDMMEKKYNSKIVGAKFKNKTYGYHTSTMKIDFVNGKTWYGSGRVDPMMKSFVSELGSRPCCFDCAFKGIEHVSDITMFDCYEFSKVTGMHDDNKGYTSLLVHTELGRKVLDRIMNQLIIYQADVDTLIAENGIMVHNSAKKNPKRDEFYEFLQQMSIDKAIEKISPITGKDYLIEHMKGFLFKTGLIKIAKKMKKEKSIQINE